jgi:hypothetical protein
MTSEEVAALENPTDSQKKQFAQQAGISDQRLREIEGMVGAVIAPIKDFVEKSMRPGIDRLIKLEQLVADIQQRPTISYERTYSADKLYKPGNLTTHAGSLWHANVATRGVAPGDGNAAWTLIVKRGRDGKDAK